MDAMKHQGTADVFSRFSRLPTCNILFVCVSTAVIAICGEKHHGHVISDDNVREMYTVRQGWKRRYISPGGTPAVTNGSGTGVVHLPSALHTDALYRDHD